MPLPLLSLIANIFVLVPMLTLLALSGSGAESMPALGVSSLGTVGGGSGAILLASVALLLMAKSHLEGANRAIRVLLLMQVVFAIAIAFMLGIGSPFSVTGLALAALHVVTLVRM